ncbi:MAG: methionyl-tRNA formyltransferase, partial [Deltaproteobacteria bacterium]|nr:methionyl-tRNA formyltransferase [Deltaproteobacteria bacterium]
MAGAPLPQSASQERGIVFMGTPLFAVPSLEALVRAGYNVRAVVTQPDKPAGRGRLTQPSPIKTAALAHNIKVLEPVKIRDEGFIGELKAIGPEFIVAVAYGKILPASVLDIPGKGCVNVHASLLPEYRGAAPVNWAIINGEKETGVSTMLMDRGMDTGPVLLEERVDIGADDTAEDLSKKLSAAGARLIVKTLSGLREGSITPRPQDGVKATYAPILKKEDGRIDWGKSAGD